MFYIETCLQSLLNIMQAQKVEGMWGRTIFSIAIRWATYTNFSQCTKNDKTMGLCNSN